jgi:hypothetical protein
MFRLQWRGSIVGAAVVVALFLSRPAAAQVGVDPGPPREPAGCLRAVITGAEYDIVKKAMAEHRLQGLEAKLRQDAERGDMAAADCDARRIDKVRYRIAIHEWLARWNSRQYPCFYPIRTDDVSAAAIAQATHPTPSPYPPQTVPAPRLMPTTPTILITIVNAEPTGATVVFAIDGLTHQAPAGSRQHLTVAADAHITYDAGESVGQRRYLITAGLYEFRSTGKGLALYKLPDKP